MAEKNGMSDQSSQQRILERLHRFVGQWTLEASFVQPAASGHAVFEWILDGQFLTERTEISGAPGSIAVVGLDTGGQAYTQHYFDSRGVARIYVMIFDGTAWTLLRNAPDFSPLDFWQRFTATFSPDGRTITGSWELSKDGSEWQHDFDLVYQKVE
jgi:hypothetical protein